MRVEDVVTRSMETCDKFYRSPGVHWSEDGKFEFTVNPHCAHRMAEVGVEDREFIRIGAEGASHQVDASVLRGERAAFRCPTESHMESHGSHGRAVRPYRV